MSTPENSGTANTADRGIFLTVIAILFIILAFSDFTKPLQHLRNPEGLGLVILGHRFHTFGSNLILGPIFGAILAAYAYGLWNLKAWTAPFSIVYAFYVPVNEVLFWSRHVHEPPPRLFILIYLALSLTGSIGTALYLAYHRDQLRS